MSDLWEKGLEIRVFSKGPLDLWETTRISTRLVEDNTVVKAEERVDAAVVEETEAPHLVTEDAVVAGIDAGRSR